MVLSGFDAFSKRKSRISALFLALVLAVPAVMAPVAVWAEEPVQSEQVVDDMAGADVENATAFSTLLRVICRLGACSLGPILL